MTDAILVLRKLTILRDVDRIHAEVPAGLRALDAYAAAIAVHVDPS